MEMVSETVFGSSAFIPGEDQSTLVDLMQWRALHQPDFQLYRFLVDGETQEEHLTCNELDRRARQIAAHLQRIGVTGGRSLLLYPPGLDYIAGFFGCLYAGVTAVPAYPPDPLRLDRTLPRLQALVNDAQPSVALTTGPILMLSNFAFAQAPELAKLLWIATDEFPKDAENGWEKPEVNGQSLAFFQYTSGSTRAPRGVMLTHANLMHNLGLIADTFAIKDTDSVMVWLPPYHDMGLIGGILEPAFRGIPCTLMSPLDFLQRPMRWLRAISRYHATISGGPNFAYDLCARKATPEQIAQLDLRGWTLSFNGAEPVRKETIDRFTHTFKPCGFRREAFYPCYGLAEATLFVSGGLRDAPPVARTVDRSALEQNLVVEAQEGVTGSQTLVSSGRLGGRQQTVIVDLGNQTRCSEGKIGEIWVSGPSVSQGYWQKPEETEQTFGAKLSEGGDTASKISGKTFLRTGDLGFILDGELFITGRQKDLIIIDGLNHYPQDIERTVEDLHPSFRPGCCAAFSVDQDGQERLVILAEIRRKNAIQPAPPENEQPINSEYLHRLIRQAISEVHSLRVYDIRLLKDGSIPKTSSGKIQRHACKEGYLDGRFVASWEE